MGGEEREAENGVGEREQRVSGWVSDEEKERERASRHSVFTAYYQHRVIELSTSISMCKIALFRLNEWCVVCKRCTVWGKKQVALKPSTNCPWLGQTPTGNSLQAPTITSSAFLTALVRTTTATRHLVTWQRSGRSYGTRKSHRQWNENGTKWA